MYDTYTSIMNGKKKKDMWKETKRNEMISRMPKIIEPPKKTQNKEMKRKEKTTDGDI